MHKLTDKLFMKVVDLTQMPGAITKVADKLLNRLVPQEDVSAAKCWTVICWGCVLGRKTCELICCTNVPLVGLVCYPKTEIRKCVNGD